jgi:superfamily I DNA and/or RNA helicase
MKGSLGFLVDKRRMNVAITRPKHFLMLVGNSSTLSRDPQWKALVEYCSTEIANGFVKFNHQSLYDEEALWVTLKGSNESQALPNHRTVTIKRT